MKVLQFSFIIQYREKKMSEKSTYSINSDDSVECDDVDFLEEEEERVEAEEHASKVDSAKVDAESKIKVSKVSRCELSPLKFRADVDDEKEGEDESEDATNKESADPTSNNEAPSEVE